MLQKISKEFANEEQFTVLNWMKPANTYIQSHISITEAAQMFTYLEEDFIPVVNMELQPTGVLYANSVINELLQGNGHHAVDKSMLKHNFTVIPADFSIIDLHPKFEQHLLVVDENQRLLGILSNKAIIKALTSYFELLNQTINTAEILNIILDSAYEGIAVVDANGIIKEFNDAYSRFIGIKKSDAIGKHVKEVIDNTNLHNTVKTGLAERGVIQYIKGQPMVVNRIPIFKNDKVVGAIGMLIFEGVTELYRIYQKFQGKSLQQPSKTDMEEKEFSPDQIIGDSSTIVYLKHLAKRIAQTDASVLITGESGTGKEMFARSIHHLSSYNGGPFVSVNCGAIPEHLFESELFGYEEGAFTGAKKGGKPGKIELAQNGTLFLDEIGDLPLIMQTKLLRVIQEKEYERVGGVKKLKMNTRIIAATNRNLKKMVEHGEFREDLYYRINVIELSIPPLRDRIEDIPLLISHYLNETCRKYNLPLKKITSDAMSVFLNYEWYGNIRELANTIEKLVILTEGQMIDVYHLPKYMKDKEIYKINHEPKKRLSILEQCKNLKMEREKEMIMEILKRTGGNKSRAAELIGIHRTTLYQKLKKYSLQ